MVRTKKAKVFKAVATLISVATVLAATVVVCKDFTGPSINEIAQSSEWEPVSISVVDVNTLENYEVTASHVLNVESVYNGNTISGTFSNLGATPNIQAGDTLSGYVNVETHELAYENYRTEFDIANIKYTEYSLVFFGAIFAIAEANIIAKWVAKQNNRKLMVAC